MEKTSETHESEMQKQKRKWYFSAWTIVVAFLVVGPFCLPLVWANPDYSRKKKIFATAVILVLSVLLFIGFMIALAQIGDYYKLMFSTQQM